MVAESAKAEIEQAKKDQKHKEAVLAGRKRAQELARKKAKREREMAAGEKLRQEEEANAIRERIEEIEEEPSLIPCRDCRHPCAVRARSCPNCGAQFLLDEPMCIHCGGDMVKSRYGSEGVGPAIHLLGAIAFVTAVGLFMAGVVNLPNGFDGGNVVVATESLVSSAYFLLNAVVVFVVAYLVQQYMWVCKNCGACARRFGK